MDNWGLGYKHPRWQKRRLEILTRDEFTCKGCESTEKMLAVHHLWYEDGADTWDYPDEALLTLCVECHEYETEQLKVEFRALTKALRRQGFMSTAVRILTKGITTIERAGEPDHIVAAAIAYAVMPRAGDQLPGMVAKWKVVAADIEARRAAKEQAGKE